MTDALTDHVVLVTGATSGIGLETARLLLDLGARVHAVGRRHTLLTERIDALGNPRARCHAVDVTDRETVGQLVAEIGSDQMLDAVVCAAGTNVPERRLDQLTADSWDEVLDTNLTGTFNIVHAALRQLRRTRGHVIAVSSVSASWPDFSGPAYQASKAGLLGFLRGAAVEEHANGVRFTTILPGLVDTELLQHRPNPPPAEMRALALQPADVATAIVYALSMPPRACVAELTILPTIVQSTEAARSPTGRRLSRSQPHGQALQ